jgi:hypothetical protein
MKRVLHISLLPPAAAATMPIMRFGICADGLSIPRPANSFGGSGPGPEAQMEANTQAFRTGKDIK